MGLSKLWNIGREALVVVAVGGLMAAVALLPQVIGAPNGQRFALSPLSAAKSTSVTAPSFAPRPPRQAQVRQRTALGLPASAVLVAPAPIARPQIRVAAAGRPAGTSLRVAPQAPPKPVAPATSVPTSTPITPAAPSSPAPTPAAPEPAITPTPTAPAAVAIGVPIRSTVSAQQPVVAEQLAAGQSDTHDSSNKSKPSHADHTKKHAQESSAAPIVALTPIAAEASGAPQESSPITLADETPQVPQQETSHKPDRVPKGAGNAIPTAEPEPTTDNGTAPDPSSAGTSAPQSSAQQSLVSSPPTQFDTSSHRHDAAAGPQKPHH